jgi:hypothetical protein
MKAYGGVDVEFFPPFDPILNIWDLYMVRNNVKSCEVHNKRKNWHHFIADYEIMACIKKVIIATYNIQGNRRLKSQGPIVQIKILYMSH